MLQSTICLLRLPNADMAFIASVSQLLVCYMQRFGRSAQNVQPPDLLEAFEEFDLATGIPKKNTAVAHSFGSGRDVFHRFHDAGTWGMELSRILLKQIKALGP